MSNLAGLPEADRVAASDLLEDNEAGPCFDQICTQLCDYKRLVDEAFLTLCWQVTRKLSIDMNDYTSLRDHVVAGISARARRPF